MKYLPSISSRCPLSRPWGLVERLRPGHVNLRAVAAGTPHFRVRAVVVAEVNEEAPAFAGRHGDRRPAVEHVLPARAASARWCSACTGRAAVSAPSTRSAWRTDPALAVRSTIAGNSAGSYIITSMHHLNSLSTYGAHPKDFDPEQVKPALSNLAIILKWYLKYKGIEILSKPLTTEDEVIIGIGGKTIDITKLEKSVAILPFKNDSKDEENTYFINGLMEEILNNLQKIKDLRVISRTSVEQYRNQTKPIPEIAKELGVNYIVEGSGQKYGNAFRLRTQLIMAAKESHLWGESYQQKINEVEDIFRIQSQIAESIATELKAIITPQEKQLIEKIPTKELEAFDAYLKGQFYWRKLTPNDLETAMQYFELAKEKDPKYALAYAGICDVWIGRQQMGIAPPSEAGPKAFEAATKALELDHMRAEVHYSVAIMKVWGMWDWEGGELTLRKTNELNPNYAEGHAFYAHLLNILGRPEEAF